MSINDYDKGRNNINGFENVETKHYKNRLDLMKVIKELNPDAKIVVDMEQVYNSPIYCDKKPEDLILPAGYYYNEKNGITDKHNSPTGMYNAIGFAPYKAELNSYDNFVELHKKGRIEPAQELEAIFLKYQMKKNDATGKYDVVRREDGKKVNLTPSEQVRLVSAYNWAEAAIKGKSYERLASGPDAPLDERLKDRRLYEYAFGEAGKANLNNVVDMIKKQQGVINLDALKQNTSYSDSVMLDSLFKEQSNARIFTEFLKERGEKIVNAPVQKQQQSIVDNKKEEKITPTPQKNENTIENPTLTQKVKKAVKNAAKKVKDAIDKVF
ncbi:MAG: hypothetical protein IJ837_00060 [Clostridia bacterium]|nr:hypothetical protein [Clostridia bacterium]